VRIIKNEFYQKVQDMENHGATVDELRDLLGKGRARKGMFEGDMTEGELEAGQVSAHINELKPAATIISEIISEFEMAKKSLSDLSF
jgi:enoyl-[acyl-carrier protein] reductase II